MACFPIAVFSRRRQPRSQRFRKMLSSDDLSATESSRCASPASDTSLDQTLPDPPSPTVRFRTTDFSIDKLDINSSAQTTDALPLSAVDQDNDSSFLNLAVEKVCTPTPSDREQDESISLVSQPVEAVYTSTSSDRDQDNPIGHPSQITDGISGNISGLGDLGSWLPLEIRELIYSHLLLADEVKHNEPRIFKHGVSNSDEDSTGSEGSANPDWRYSNHAYRYAFNTNAFLVCKAMYAEAKRYLYSRNTFVLMKYEMPHFLRELHCANVPIVADRGLSRTDDDNWTYEIFSGWSLKIDVSWLKFQNPNKLEPVDSGHILLLWQDMPIFCQWLKRICVNATPKRVYIQEFPFRPRLYPTAEREGVPRTRLEVRKKQLRPRYVQKLGERRQRDFLELLRPATGIGYNLTAVNFSDKALVREVKQATAPNIIWLRALDQARMEAVLAPRQLIPPQLPSPDPSNPPASFPHPTTTLRDRRWLPRKLRINRHHDPWRQHIYHTCNVFNADRALALAEHMLTLRLDSIFDVFIDDDLATVDRLRHLTSNWLLDVRYWHARAEVAIVMAMEPSQALNVVFPATQEQEEGIPSEQQPEVSAAERMQDVRRCIVEIKAINGWNTEPDVSNDVPHFERLLTHFETQDALPSQTDWLENYRPHICPFRYARTFDSTKALMPLMVPPRKYEGWQDVEALENMDEETKKACVEFAEKHGLVGPGV